MSLTIEFKDPYLVAINKPAGLLVHRSVIAADAKEFAVQLLRDQLGQKVFPVHRLDRKTSGLLLFALDESTNRIMQRQFAERKIRKNYLAIVRGFTEESGTIDYPLANEKGDRLTAITHYTTLQRSEIRLPFGKHDTSRYSLLELRPETGRFHQLRKHLAHIYHPIIGDRPHGCNKQNRLWKEEFNMTTMLLHASGLQFRHPQTDVETELSALVPHEFKRVSNILGFDLSFQQQPEKGNG